MKNRRYLFALILLFAMIFLIYSLVRYNERLPGDVLGNILFFVTIICIISGVVLVFVRPEK